MPYETYKFLHLVGIVLLVLGLGGALVASRGQGGGKGFCMLLHGAGLLLVLVAGFGMQARRGIGFPGWFLAKIGLWVLLAILPTMVKRGVISIGTGILFAGILGGAAIYLVIYRPF